MKDIFYFSKYLKMIQILSFKTSGKYNLYFNNIVKNPPLIKYILIIIFLFCETLNTNAQFFDNFSNSDLSSDPKWDGDAESFTVNNAEQLQLNETDAGRKFIYTASAIPDTAVWEMDILMDFSPSASNKLRVFLMWDNPDPDNGNGYYLEIGENGSADAFNFYFSDESGAVLLGTGSIGALASDPAFASFEIKRSPDGLWEFRVAYDEQSPKTEELILMHRSGTFSEEQFFIIDCLYTSSRSKSFFFDNVGIQAFVPDTQGPEVLEVTVVDPINIIIQCNEPLDEISAFNAIINIDPYLGNILSSSLINDDSGIAIVLTEPLSSGIPYSFSISGLKDKLGNEGSVYNTNFFLLSEPEPGDLIINEILFNPETGGVDYLELFNVSDKYLNINHLLIENNSRGDSEELFMEERLEPGKYICLTEDPQDIRSRFSPPDTAFIVQSDLPAFNNDTGNVTIYGALDMLILDQFNYSENMHFSELDDVNGVALERINPYGITQDPNNWFSGSSSTGYGTPGYQNSIFLNPQYVDDEVLDFEKKTFSPNQDGVDDQLIIKYNLPEVGYLTDIYIYDQYGRFCKKLVNNQLLSAQGLLFWDGLNESGEVERIGIYFIILEAHNTDGNVIKVKKPIILADYLD